jgi:threonine dehydrogenase-like Zn-dependent dehydrogenase
VKALVWKGGSTLDYEDTASLPPQQDEVVLEIELAGICGSDLHGYRGHPGPRVPPLVLGHEAVGELDGERFTIFPLIGCGSCRRCLAGEVNLCAQWRLIGMHRPGVFAERVTLPRSSLVAVPLGLASERAVLTEPLACAVAALGPHRVGVGVRVAVLGCGPIGLLAIQLAAARGAEVTAVDPLSERRALASRLGASTSAASVEELEPASVELVVDAAGFPASWQAALSLVVAGGEVVVLGLGAAEGPLAMAVLVRRGIRMRGQFAYSREDFAQALAALGSESMDVDWCLTQPLSEGATAFQRLVEEPSHYTKILLAT